MAFAWRGFVIVAVRYFVGDIECAAAQGRAGAVGPVVGLAVAGEVPAAALVVVALEGAVVWGGEELGDVDVV